MHINLDMSAIFWIILTLVLCAFLFHGMDELLRLIHTVGGEARNIIKEIPVQ